MCNKRTASDERFKLWGMSHATRQGAKEDNNQTTKVALYIAVSKFFFVKYFLFTPSRLDMARYIKVRVGRVSKNYT